MAWYIDMNGKRIGYLSVSRAAACIAVVILHTVYAAYELNKDTLNEAQIVVSQIIVNISMWSVPVFLMVSGVLLLDPQREITYGKIFGKYLKRVFAALLGCGLAFRLFDLVMDGEVPTPGKLLYGFYEIYTGNGWSHLWYLYLLLAVYLMLPFYRMISARASAHDIRYFLLIIFLFLGILPLSGIWKAKSAFYIDLASFYPFYFFFGYALHNGMVRISKKQGIALFMIGAVLNALVSYFLYARDCTFLSPLIGFTRIPSALEGMGAFAFFHGTESAPGVLLMLDRETFPVYLIHMVFVRLVLRYLGVNPYAYGTAGSILLFLILVSGFTLASYLISRLFSWLFGVRKRASAGQSAS